MFSWLKRLKRSADKSPEFVYEDPPPLSAEKQRELDAANALFRAAWNDDVSRVDVLLDSGVPVDAIGESGEAALQAAIENCAFTTMRRLLERGASADRYPNRDGNSPLSHALEMAIYSTVDRQEIVDAIKSLCSHGAQPGRFDGKLNRSAVEYAAELAAHDQTREIGRALLVVFDQYRLPTSRE